MKDAYSYPEYCDVAYGWDRSPECDFIERCAERYSGRKGDSVLDLACGTGIHLREFARRGYRAAGIDRSREMAAFVAAKAEASGLKIDCSAADMKDFPAGGVFSFAICMLDSFRYLLTDRDIAAHLGLVSASLEDGGIYFLDLWMPPSEIDIAWEDVSWSRERGGTKVDARYLQHGRTYDPADRTFEDELIFKVESPAFGSTITSRARTRMLLYGELCRIAGEEGSFEPMGKFYNFDFDEKGAYNSRHIRTNIVLKKRR
ncbi:MAG: class I SAM-dependent methyltransferase [Candidatus Omnitrophota bacterium]